MKPTQAKPHRHKLHAFYIQHICDAYPTQASVVVYMACDCTLYNVFWGLNAKVHHLGQQLSRHIRLAQVDIQDAQKEMPMLQQRWLTTCTHVCL